MPGFGRIAIWDEERSDADPESWASVALAKDADAFLLRLSKNSTTDVHAHIETLRQFSLPVIVNHPDGVPVPGADGIHLKEGQPLPAGAGSLIRGRSCHSIRCGKVAEAQGFDYVFFSPVYETASHPGGKAAGIDALRQFCREIRLPVFALGGITDDAKIHSCLEAGAAGFAGIDYFSEK